MASCEPPGSSHGRLFSVAVTQCGAESGESPDADVPRAPLVCRFVCKGALKSLWFYGWSMQTFFFPFLSRSSTNRSADLDMLGRMCRYLTVERRLRNSVVLFPEGTDLSDSNLRKDKECVPLAWR